MAKSACGIMLLTGEPGTGKTVAVRRFVDSLSSERYVCCYLPLATVTILDVYGQLNRALGGVSAHSKSQMFDELRIPLNFEMDSKDPLLLILVGQPQLLAKLALRIHLPFPQRVAMRYRMPPMDEEQTRGYVDHHLRLAGRKHRLFTDEAMTQLFVQSGGVARVVGLEEVITASREVV